MLIRLLVAWLKENIINVIKCLCKCFFKFIKFQIHENKTCFAKTELNLLDVVRYYDRYNMVVHLHPLPTRLHGEDQARIWFAQSITVGNAFTAQLEFHFRQIRTTEQAKRVSCWFVDVTHGWCRTGILWIRMPNKLFGKWKLWVMIYLNSIQFDLFCVNIFSVSRCFTETRD